MLFGKKEAKLKEEIELLKKEVSNIKTLISLSSMGNKGVQTDSQHTSNKQLIDRLGTTFGRIEKSKKELGTTNEAVEIVNLVNDYKDSIKNKFKSLTDQEFFVFCLIYSLEEQLGAVSYKDIALKAGLTESVIRDHVRHIFGKSIPLLKEKKNNKLILLKVSPELKGIISLDSLVKIHDPYSAKRSLMAENAEETIIYRKI